MWCADITYIPVQGGFLYLVAIMDWASRRVLAWRLSNTMDTEFCLAALAEALESYGIPEIFNTDQGSQFTVAFTGFWRPLVYAVRWTVADFTKPLESLNSRPTPKRLIWPPSPRAHGSASVGSSHIHRLVHPLLL